ncbi:MAG TPA: acyltransferase [Steroidobacteraceae bacterium]
MSPTSFAPAIVATLLAAFISFLLSRKYTPIAGADRFLSLDGLRGYLALFVFLQHSAVWYYYLRTGRWQPLPSQLYTHFGPVAVSLFFMITGFLFYSKLLNARHRSFDWARLYVARVLRLAPLYLFAIALMLMIVIIMSAGARHNSLGKTAWDVFRWTTFTILGSPDINGLKIADVAVAEVVWTLPYEWLFYLALPLFALTVGIRPSWPYLLLGLLAVAGALIRHLDPIMLLMFAGGIIAAQLVRYERFSEFAASRTATIVAIVSVGTALAFFPYAYKFAPFVLLAVFFCIVAAGNDLFGLLTRPAARKLGEMAYSIYMLHGLVLYTTFIFIVGTARSRTLSPLQHWAIVIGIIPALLLICHTTFRFIEHPPMQKTRDVENWLKSRLPPRLGGVVS